MSTTHSDGNRASGGTGEDTDPEERWRLRVHDLQHRMRNTIAVIRSMARRTGETAETVAEYAAHLDGRISALSRVQSTVAGSPSGDVDLAVILSDELRAHAASEDGQALLGGPPVLLRPKPAETLALALHELTSTAVKFGALSRSQGRLAVTWRVDENLFRLDWVESGLPAPLAAPTRRGFGVEHLEKTLPYELGASVDLQFAPSGLVCRIVIPISAIGQSTPR